MASATDVIGVIAEVFTWVGIGGAVALGILAAALKLADGTWLPVRAVVEPVHGGRVVRWIDADGEIGEASLSAHQAAEIGGADMADVYYRRGSRDRMRLHPGSPAVRAIGSLAVGFGALGLASTLAQLILLFVEG